MKDLSSAHHSLELYKMKKNKLPFNHNAHGLHTQNNIEISEKRKTNICVGAVVITFEFNEKNFTRVKSTRICDL